MIIFIPFPLQIYAISITIRIVVSFLYMKNIFRISLIINLPLVYTFFFVSAWFHVTEQLLEI